MAFTLTKRPRNPNEPPKVPRVNIENADPERIYAESEPKPQPAPAAAAPAPAAARPPLTFGKTNPNAPVEANTTVPTNTVTPRPMEPLHSAYEMDTAELEDRNKPNEDNPYLKPERRNSKLKSMFLGALQGGGEAARAALASGNRDPLAMALGGALGGGVGGAIHDSWDEEQKNADRKAEIEHNIAYKLKQEEAEADTGYKRARPALEMRKLENDRDIADQRAQVQRDLEDGRMSRAEAELKMKQLDRKSREHEGQLNRESREKVASTRSMKDLKVPDTFYRGKDPERIKDMALERVLGSGQYGESDFNPKVIQLYTKPEDNGDQEKVLARISSAVRAGTLNPGEVFIDPRKGAQFQQHLASAHHTISGEAQEFDRAIDMTSKSTTYTDEKGQKRPTQRIAYADFESTWEKFLGDYKGAKDEKSRNKIRRQYEQALAGVRLAGE